MKYRIAMWGSAGFLVAGFWALYLFPSAIFVNPITFALAQATVPITLLTFFFHFSLRFYWVLLANAATYAFAGLMIEVLRRQLHPAR